MTTTSAAAAGSRTAPARESLMAQFKDWVELDQGRSLPDYQALWA